MSVSYTFQARRVPVAAVAVPPIVLAGAGIITSATLGITSGAVLAVAAAIAGQLGRDRGKRLEPALWASWGGSPTLQRLRFRGGSRFDRVERLHMRISSVIDVTLPTSDEEAADPEAADERYDEISATIRALTRDQSRFGLLFAENVNYGLRRNLLGLRRVGQVVAASTVAAAGFFLWLADGSLTQRAARYGPGAGAGLLMLAFWVFVVKPGWVRLTADAYADQFVGAIDVMAAEPSEPHASRISGFDG
jgi:hypothetical protein